MDRIPLAILHLCVKPDLSDKERRKLHGILKAEARIRPDPVQKAAFALVSLAMLLLFLGVADVIF